MLFKYVPMGGLLMAFKSYDARLGIFGSPWLGFRNFSRFIESYEFMRVLKNTLALSFYSLFAGFPMPIIFALALNATPRVRFRKLVQTVTYLPHFISTVVIVGLLIQLFNTRTGAYGAISQYFTGEVPANIYGTASSFRHFYVWSGVWQGLGFHNLLCGFVEHRRAIARSRSNRRRVAV